MFFDNTLIDKTMHPDYWVYILYCSNNGLYTGYSKNVISRYKTHSNGKGSKYTRSFPPLFIAAVFPIYGTKNKAMKLETKIKKLSKKNKAAIIDNPELLEIHLK